jgi:hypothetical protein
MKRADIIVGKKYMLSLGRRGAVAVTVVAEAGIGQFRCWTSDARSYEVSARKLSGCPVTDVSSNFLGFAHETV